MKNLSVYLAESVEERKILEMEAEKSQEPVDGKKVDDEVAGEKKVAELDAEGNMIAEGEDAQEEVDGKKTVDDEKHGKKTILKKEGDLGKVKKLAKTIGEAAFEAVSEMEEMKDEDKEKLVKEAIETGLTNLAESGDEDYDEDEADEVVESVVAELFESCEYCGKTEEEVLAEAKEAGLDFVEKMKKAKEDKDKD